MNLKTLLPAVICLALLGTVATVAAPVKVEGGLVEGTVENGLAVYRGIPFAAPPVGDLRWQAPRAAGKWEGVLRADKFAARCMQGGGPGSPDTAQAPNTSEDCLYLNVWSPAKSAGDRVPVLVWIYGGGFSGGATSIPTYSGEQLAKRGVVLVSIAYRVGPFGFLAHPGLSAETRNRVSGNYGLLDMIAGLQWIQKNITSFGGDPRRVTIFGESAGGIAVSMLCASPLAKGLFHGAISQSGGSFGPPRVEGMPGENMVRLADAERAGEAYAKSAGASSIEALRKLPADKVLATTKGQRGLGWPIVDGWVIPDDQYKLYQAGRYNDTPILVGYNSDEGLSFSFARTPDEYVKYVRERFGPHADNLLELYPVGATAVTKSARDLMRDAAFGWHTWIWARLHSKARKSKVFYYYFDQHPPRVPGSPEEDHGSRHGLDLPYVFQHLGELKPSAMAADQMISDSMATYWTNFAKGGNPNGGGVPNWPAFSDASPLVMYLSQPPHTGPVPGEEGLKRLDDYFAWRRTPEGESAAPAEPAVTVAGGKLLGSATGAGGAVFKGIPFGQPPTGDLRWREPLAAKPWTGVRDATAFAPACTQTGALGEASSEDCLYLNVWTPEWPAKSRRAVMVWFHGGGNFAGTSSEPAFDGVSLTRRGVILVTANYRLGIFGFFAHPDLTKESAHHASGNQGLLDQILALRWVHDNIARFGGDPANVTIFGESAGSLDVNVLMATPLSRGLFQRVIGESGPVVNPPPLAEGEKKGSDLAAKLNLTGAAVLAKLRALPAPDIQKAAGQGLSMLGPILGVVVDGWLFPESPLKVFAEGREHRVGLLLGSNSQELQRPFFPMQGTLAQAIADEYGPLADRALAVYGLNGAAEPKPDPDFGPAMAQWATDSQFRCGSVAELVWHTAAKNPGYHFQFARTAPGKESAGAAHGSEVAFVFGTMRQPSPTDQQISAAMQEYWTNFAKTGDPNGGNLPIWPKFDPQARQYLEFANAGPAVKEGLRRAACDLFTENWKRQIRK